MYLWYTFLNLLSAFISCFASATTKPIGDAISSRMGLHADARSSYDWVSFVHRLEFGVLFNAVYNGNMVKLSSQMPR